MSDRDVVIVSACRTPFSKFGGILKDFRSIDLAALVMKEVLRRVEVRPEEVEEINYGVSILAEVALETDCPARQATLKAGFPPESLSLTFNRACCSSLSALRLGALAIRAGEIDIALAVGSDNMGRAPFLVEDARWGIRLGHRTLRDPLFEFGYRDFSPVAKDAGEVALEYGVTREEQDQWAIRSQQRFAAAQKEGKFKVGEEIVAVEVPQKKGPPLIFDQDEGARPDTTLEALSKLPTVYGSPTVTAGNSPGLSTGATAILIMSRRKAREKGIKPLATILTCVATAQEPRYIATIPAHTIQKTLLKANMSLDSIDLIEINEAFAAMPLVSSKILAGGDEKKLEQIRNKLNVNGGAIAIGHPVGASALRITMTLAYELKRRGGGYGIGAICGGLAQGEGILIHVTE
ncbi:MAG: thiolase family protein [Candidatus Anstonellales archaeon]